MTAASDWRALPGAGFGALFGVVVGMVLPSAAQAQSFTWQSGAQARAESNSNPALSADAGGALVSRTVSASVLTQRNTEAAQTQGDAELILTPSERDSSSTALGRLSLRHRLSAPRETWTGSLAYRRDRTLGAASTTTSLTAGEVAVGRTDHTVGEGALAWSHAFSERLSSDLNASHARNTFRNSSGRTDGSAAVGNDYALSSASAGLQHAWRETTSLSATLSRTEQRPLDAGPSAAPGLAHTGIDGLRLSVNEVLSETGSAGLSVSRSTTTRDFTLFSPVCPLPVRFCQGGIVRYVLAPTPVRTRSHDLQYSANASLRWDETTALAARLARSLTPGALGVSREDVLSLSASRSFSETTSAGLGFDVSRSLQASAATGGATTATLRSLTLRASHRLGERLTLSTQLLQRNYQRPSPQSGARATVFSISLQYQGATVPVWR